MREHPGGRRRLGRSGLASPWRTCADGCCLFLVGTVAAHAAAQWLRILRSSLAAEGHDLSGEVLVPGPGARPPVLLVVLAGEVVEAVLDVGA